jgi:uncharacterized protein YgiM (DUF1202 family)
MRVMLRIAGIVMLVSVGSATAQTRGNEFTVVADVEVRSGPSREFAATSRLQPGDRVEVLQDSKAQDGWLAIRPPQGSFSWIDAKQVTRLQPNSPLARVENDTSVRCGTLSAAKPLAVDVGKATKGTQVVIVGQEVTTEGGAWLPITPGPQEVRYIPREAVGNTAVASKPSNVPARLTSITNTQPGQPTATANNPTTTQYRTGPGSTAPTMTYAPQWSVWGRLRSTTLQRDGQPLYVLESKQGQQLMYVTTQPGFSLRDYVGRSVALYGPLTYRSDDYIRMHYMTASHVAALP